MNANLKELQDMAKGLHEHGGITDATMERINTRVAARAFRERIEKAHAMSGAEIKNMRSRYKMSQSSLAYALNMSVESISKWERNENKPSGAALRLLNLIDEKGPDIFAS
ncbi:helix-turn-helix domain-containing protein [Yersinia alsatica]|uniref:helix-turn-helix domain-containing protein n=1 Tax=Yersinia alsatica TaxID=2890317 RepID=UPI0011A132A6|nr:helix-turn-helix domain-containing protein [Yersinia alsatica]